MPLRTIALSFKWSLPGRGSRRGGPADGSRHGDTRVAALLFPVANLDSPAVTLFPRDEARGLTLVAISTLAYGVLPIFVKFAYAAGVGATTMLAWRYAIAALLIAATVDRRACRCASTRACGR